MDTQLHQLHRTQKIGFVLLSVFGICVLILGTYQFRTLIYGPFALAPIERDNDMAAIEDLFDEELRLQRIDTDGDGISDWDELYVYNTSPYLADTDSDGVSDYDEIFVYKTDPNCPTGADCEIFNSGQESTLVDESRGTSVLFGDAMNDTEILLGGIADAASIIESQQSVGQDVRFDTSPTMNDEIETIQALIQNPEAIRELLRQTGTLSEAEISAFSDELLIETVISLLSE
jgi:hypothetical protein